MRDEISTYFWNSKQVVDPVGERRSLITCMLGGYTFHDRLQNQNATRHLPGRLSKNAVNRESLRQINNIIIPRSRSALQLHNSGLNISLQSRSAYCYRCNPQVPTRFVTVPPTTPLCRPIQLLGCSCRRESMTVLL